MSLFIEYDKNEKARLVESRKLLLEIRKLDEKRQKLINQINELAGITQNSRPTKVKLSGKDLRILCGV